MVYVVIACTTTTTAVRCAVLSTVHTADDERISDTNRASMASSSSVCNTVSSTVSSVYSTTTKVLQNVISSSC